MPHLDSGLVILQMTIFMSIKMKLEAKHLDVSEH